MAIKTLLNSIFEVMSYLTINQSISLLPPEFKNIVIRPGGRNIYSSSMGNLYFTGSMDYGMKSKTWWYSIHPETIKRERIAYIVLAADVRGIFLIPAYVFFAYRKRHPVGTVKGGREHFSIRCDNNRYIRHEAKCEDEDITKYFYPAKKDVVAPKPKILFANIGWMVNYNGQHQSDQILGGGSYSDADKHEVFNFQDLNGKCYGYVQAKYDTINLSRIDSSVEDWMQKVEDVLVIWFATNPVVGGSWVVGWYKHATVFREYQKSNATQRDRYGYYMLAKSTDCTLLPVDDRVKQIPRQVKNYPGRSNIWYADSNDVKTYISEIVSYVESYKSRLKKHRKPLPTISSDARAKVEQAAIKAVWNLYEQRGYKIKDVQSENYGWDLEATNGRHKLYLEVKGQGNHDPYIRISRNEYEQMINYKDIYRLCVVMDSLNEADIYVFLSHDEDKWVCEDDDSRELNINEQIAAIATF
ncbi:MAG: DUF3883 domain-containing protein [Bacteroidales bacterium]|nr:DUF3883 domain-containing protein [Bacteroidales bacterium]